MATEFPIFFPHAAEGLCRLCDGNKALQVSHIVPAFAIRWLKDTSGNIPIRNTKEPNLRVQDGLKLPWLCSDCEGVLGRWETAFCNGLFNPITKEPDGRYKYLQWLNRFCISLSWRIARYALETNKFAGWSPEQVVRLQQAEIVWRDCLLEKQPHPGLYEQHLLPFQEANKIQGDFDESLNRYLLRDVEMDLCYMDTMIFTWAKLGPIAVIGFVYCRDKSRWKGSKVHANEGLIVSKRYELPMELAEYINGRCRKIRERMQTASPKQQAIIEETLKKNIDSFAESDLFKAFKADADLFGENAVLKDADKRKA